MPITFKRTLTALVGILLAIHSLSAQSVDVKVSSVNVPVAYGAAVRSHQSFIPSAVIGNLGSETIAAVPVRCEIMNTSGSIVYLSDQTVWFLPAHEELPVIFDAATEGLPAGAYNFKVSLQLVNDANPSNDRITGSFFAIWDSAASMNVARRGHTANLLKDGRVLVAGGEWPTLIYNSCEIYTPNVNNGIGRWDMAASMSAARTQHTATMLPDGRVFVAGGVNASFGREASCEIFDPTANSGMGSWKQTSSMATARSGHTATLLKNGKILVAGGLTPSGITSACELFDPSANNGEGAWSSCAAMSARRSGAAALLLGDGRVLMTGGTIASYVEVSSCEVFDPSADNGQGSWTIWASMNAARSGHSIVPLANGNVFVTGGGAGTAEIFDFGSGKWVVTGVLSVYENIATLLPEGDVIVTGQGTAESQIYDPSASNGAGAWKPGPLMMNPKNSYSVTLLSNGRVLAAGGSISTGSTSSCESFDIAETQRVHLPARLAVTTIFPETLVVHRPFAVVVEARDDSARPQNVSVSTTVRLACGGGSGSLHGELTAIIPAGENRIRFTDVAYDAAQETLRICASTESGMSLLPDTSAGIFVGAARVPIAPKMIEANPGDRKVTLIWQKNPEKNIARYLLFQGTHPDTLALVDSTAGAHDTTKTIAGLLNDSLYYFCVIAVDSVHVQSPRSSVVEANPALFSLRTISGIDSVDCGTMAWGDFNGDGLLDVVMSGAKDVTEIFPSMYSTIYLHKDHNVLQNISAALVPVRSGELEWCDFNDDNLPDIFLAGFNDIPTLPGTTRLYRNIGNKQFSEIVTSFSQFGTSLASSDYDNDGKIDVIVSGWTGASGNTTLYHNEGGNIFSAKTLAFTPQQYATFSWIDVDNDGDLDLIMGGTNSSVELYRNDGAKGDTGWTFTKISNPFPSFAGSYQSAAWGDYDNDGDLDVVVGGWNPDAPSSAMVLYKNDGKGAFTDAHAVGLPNVLCFADCGDYDGDGKIDLAFSRNSSLPIISRNMGNFSFAPVEASLRLNTVGNVWGDYDNDGDLDLMAVTSPSSGPRTPVYFQNNLESHNTRPSAPSGLQSVPTAHSVKLSWQRATDNETPSMGLSYNLSIGTTRGGCEIMSPMANLSTGKRYVTRLGNVDEDTAWVIRNLPNGRYYWTVQAIDPSYTGSVFAAVDSFTINVTEAQPEAIAVPRAYALAQNFPNPFNPSTTIRFSLPSQTHVSLKIYDALGREVSSLVSEDMTSGTYSRQWNASGMPSGVYFYRLQAGGFTETKRMIILK